MRIVRVGALDSNMIDVELSNGNILLLNMSLLKDHSDFRALFEDGGLIYPKTDGVSVFWENGPRLSLEKMVALLENDID